MILRRSCHRRFACRPGASVFGGGPGPVASGVLQQMLVGFLRNDPLSPLQVEEVMVEDDEMANFVNLLLLLMETP